MNIDRRKFIKVGGIFSAVAVQGSFCNLATASLNTTEESRSKMRSDIEESIKANFGSGFQVLEYYHAGDVSSVKVEHLENQYLVQSYDLVNWEISGSSIS